jgi:hypothetical protein
MATGFLLAEDEAVKAKFSGITLADDRNGARPVKVFYRWPEQEMEKAFPFITIECIGITHAEERQHSDQYLYGFVGTPSVGQEAFMTPATSVTYWPDTDTDVDQVAGAAAGWVRTQEFVPVNLMYQVATHTRSALHDRQLTAILMGTQRIPFRFGHLLVPADDSVRRFDCLGWQQADMHDGEAGNRKMIFRKVYTLQTTAELPPFTLTALGSVSSVQRTVDTVDPVY